MSTSTRSGWRAAARLIVCAAVLAAGPGMVWAQTEASDSIVYRVVPASRFQVTTGKAGLFGFAGHSHVVRARGFKGWVIYHPGRPAASLLELTIPAESLEVLTPPDTAEIRKVNETMRTQVLHVAEYPVIRFTATGSRPTPKGMRLQGELTLVGRTRAVPVDAVVKVATDTLRASGKFTVKQTDFGIKPFSGGPAGTVKVADRVTFVFDAIAVRESSSATDRTGPQDRGGR